MSVASGMDKYVEPTVSLLPGGPGSGEAKFAMMAARTAVATSHLLDAAVPSAVVPISVVPIRALAKDHRAIANLTFIARNSPLATCAFICFHARPAYAAVLA